MAKRKRTRPVSPNQDIQAEIKSLEERIKTASRSPIRQFMNQDGYRAQIDKLTNKWCEQLVAQYANTLIANGYGKSKEAVTAKNIINVENLFPLRKNQRPTELPPNIYSKDPEFKKWEKENHWLCAIPCFETGTIRITPYRYATWEIKTLDLENAIMVIAIQQYTSTEATPWEPGIQGTYHLAFTDATEKTICNMSYNTYPQIYKKLNYKTQLHWNDEDIKKWNSHIIQGAENAMAEFDHAHTNPGELLLKMFMTIIARVNYELSKHKASRPKQTPATVSYEKPKIITQENPQERTQFVRTIGGLSVKSEKPPKPPTKRTVIHYSTATWPVKGHVRKYKNGKTVYIKPTVKHRKALQSQTDKPLQTIINFPEKHEK